MAGLYEKSDKIIIQQGDILGLDVDAIVNPTNTDLLLGAGIAGEIRKRGGADIQMDCLEIGNVGIGQSAITAGGDLKCRHIIHAATMKLGGVTTETNLRNAIISVSRRINELKLKTVAIPPMGIGVGRFPLRRAAEVMVETVLTDVVNRQCLEKVYLVLPDEDICSLFEETYKRLTGDAASAEVQSE